MEISQLKSSRPNSRLLAVVFASALLLAACGSSAGEATSDSVETDNEATTTEAAESTEADTTDTTGSEDTDAEGDSETAVAGAGLDIALFMDDALVGEPTIEDCTLSGGVETSCYSITVAGYPADGDAGPFCPSTITDEVGGLWWDGDNIYDLNGEFIANLAETYNDDTWQMFDEDGNVLVTETAEEFDLAARPDVDPSLVNHCVEGMLEWLENGEPITTTALIPVEPVLADSSAAPQGNHGVTLNGVVIAASAPVEAILGAYTIAAFDDCGAHFNPFDGYHLHGAVGCSEVGEGTAEDPAMFGYAMDGFPIHSPYEDAAAEEAAGLDECNGHTSEEDGYHYHANRAEENQVVECLIGQTVATAGAGGGGGGERPEGPPPGQEG